MATAIARLETVEVAERWRMQPMGNERVRIINDAYNASPDSMAAALRTLAQITGPDERTVAVLGAMSELGETAGEEHDRIGLLAVRLNIQRIVVVGDAGRGFERSRVAPTSFGVSLSIEGRLGAVGGLATVRSRPGRGTTVELRWPAGAAR